jgi:hypothetical protein
VITIFGLQTTSPFAFATYPEIKTIVNKATNFMLKLQVIFQNCREIQKIVAFYDKQPKYILNILALVQRSMAFESQFNSASDKDGQQFWNPINDPVIAYRGRILIQNLCRI